ncbi:hypothetical protein M3Y99_00182100 [Aphelenchoides fujianensis]|nr:hypothetical protein M3Y99_00182100 [Aphelenchoides fujianensis]
MSDRRFRAAHATYLNNAQPVQQQFYANSMPWNDYYNTQLSSQAGNGVYARPMASYGNGTTAGGFAHRLNPDAAPFQPGVRYETHNQPAAPMTAYNAHYSSYYTPQPQAALHAQQAAGYAPQHQMRGYQQSMQAYDPAPRSQYQAVHQMYAQTPSQFPMGVQQPAAQQYGQAPKYQQQQMSASQSPHSYMSTPQDQQLSVFAQNDVNGMQAVGGDLSPAFSQFPISQELSNAIQNHANKMAIVEVQIGLEQLVTEPHEFELWANAIKGRVGSGLSKDDLETVAWLIVEMSFMGTNAQYAFARLCRLLDSEVKGFTCTYVIPRIALFMEHGVDTLEPLQLSNFVVFLGELYDKTENNGVRVSRLGTHMMNQIRVLLSTDDLSDQIVKSVVQVLKLTGRHVEDDQDPVYLNQVFDRLNELMENSRSISESVKHNIRQLNQLREKQWGVTKNDDLLNGAMHGSIYSGTSDRTEGVMYGPDGQPLSEEERRFLEESCRDMDPGFGMDDDAQQDYDAFLREQAEATAVGTAEKALQNLSVDEES